MLWVERTTVWEWGLVGASFFGSYDVSSFKGSKNSPSGLVTCLKTRGREEGGLCGVCVGSTTSAERSLPLSCRVGCRGETTRLAALLPRCTGLLPGRLTQSELGLLPLPEGGCEWPVVEHSWGAGPSGGGAASGAGATCSGPTVGQECS